MNFSNSDIILTSTDKTLQEFIKNSQQIFLEINDSLEHSSDICILDTFKILSNDEIFYHLQYHQKIIINFLYIQQIEVLNDFFISSYRVFLSKGVQIDFFLLLYTCVKNSANKYLFSADMIVIERIYNYLESNHKVFIKYAQEKKNIKLDMDIEKLYNYALKGDFEDGIILCESYCVNIDNFNHFFATKISILMNYVGYQWELGEITFAVEHKITSYIDNILDYFFNKLQTSEIANSKTILITNAPNEEHTLGVKLISKSLIKIGHNVLRIDSNATIEQLFEMIERVKPDYVAFSVTLVSNIYKLTTAINKLQLESKSFKIIIGGKAFEHIPDPVKTTNADLFFSDIEQLANYFQKEKNV